MTYMFKQFFLTILFSILLGPGNILAMDLPQKNRPTFAKAFDIFFLLSSSEIPNDLVKVISIHAHGFDFFDKEINFNTPEDVFNMIKQMSERYSIGLSSLVLKNLLINSGKSLSAITDDVGNTVLHVACGAEKIPLEQDRFDCSKIFLSLDDTELIFTEKNNGWTALHCAARDGLLSIVNALIEAIDKSGQTEKLLFIQDRNDCTALHLAKENVVYVLLVAADRYNRAKDLATVKDIWNENPLEQAKLRYDKPLYKELCNYVKVIEIMEQFPYKTP